MNQKKHTSSICPVCFQEGSINKIDAIIKEEDGQLWMEKHCPHHGSFKEMIFGDAELYYRWMRYNITGDPVADIQTTYFDIPSLYESHLSRTVLTNLIVTNRCNLRCSFCSMNAGATNHVYEPPLEKIHTLLEQARTMKPYGSQALQITGGEPTLRDDLFEIIHMAEELGFSHIQLHTNGVKLAQNPEYSTKLYENKLSTVYLSFDGVSQQTNPLIEYNKKALEHLQKAGMQVVLIPTLIRGKNVHEAGEIIRFAIDHCDVVKGVHFQPISFCGKAGNATDEERKQNRVDVADFMQSIEHTFPGEISRKDFYPTSITSFISALIETMSGDVQPGFTAHPGCGGTTFLYVKDGKPVPMNRFLNVDVFVEFTEKQFKKKGPLKKLRFAADLVQHMDSFTNKETAPPGFDFSQFAQDAALIGRDYAMRMFHHHSLVIGFMFYQDPWNLRMDRLQRCVVHCTTFEGMMPYCSYLALGLHEKLHKKHGLSQKEWEQHTGQCLADDIESEIPCP